MVTKERERIDQGYSKGGEDAAGKRTRAGRPSRRVKERAGGGAEEAQADDGNFVREYEGKA